MEHKRDAMWRRERMAREAHDRRMYREEERMVRQIERGIARDVIRGVDNMIHGGPGRAHGPHHGPGRAHGPHHHHGPPHHHRR